MFHGVALRRVHALGALGTADVRELQPAKAAASGQTPPPSLTGWSGSWWPVDLNQCGVAAHTVVILYWVRESCAQSPLQGEEYVHIGPGGRAARLAAAVVCPSQGGDLALSLIHISEPTRRTPISYAVFCLKK